MAFNSGYFSVTTTAAVINTDASESGNVGGVVTIRVPAGGQTVYLGGAAVTADTTAGTAGFIVQAGETFSHPYGSSELLYAIVAATTQSVYVLREGI